MRFLVYGTVVTIVTFAEKRKVGLVYTNRIKIPQRRSKIIKSKIMAAPPEQEGEGTNIPQGSTADQVG